MLGSQHRLGEEVKEGQFAGGEVIEGRGGSIEKRRVTSAVE